jgi:23S rRNA (cytidine1920-2'-O)/16S rRNA (cytidine1409-2'-O)-methyltransferase
MEKTRIDILVHEKGLAETRNLAQRMVMAGQVRVNGEQVIKPATKVPNDALITIEGHARFVSRGGEKLESALVSFNIHDLVNWICVDIGASTGGFTDCLLQHGAKKVYAVDVGYGDFHWKLRNHPAVVLMERTNARHIEGFPDDVDLVTIDASFISLKTLFPIVRGWFGQKGGKVITLIKPQFEAGKKDAARGKGVIRDPEIHQRVLLEVLTQAQVDGFGVNGLVQSPLTGPKGNIEFLALLEFPLRHYVDVIRLVEEIFPPSIEAS